MQEMHVDLLHHIEAPRKSDFQLLFKTMNAMGLTIFTGFSRSSFGVKLIRIFVAVCLLVLSGMALSVFPYLKALAPSKTPYGPGLSFMFFVQLSNVPPILCMLFGIVYCARNYHLDLVDDLTMLITIPRDNFGSYIPGLGFTRSFKQYIRSFLIVSTVIVLVVWISSGVWLFFSAQWSMATTSWIIYGFILTITFPFRLFVPFLVCLLFVLECRRIALKLDSWLDSMTQMRRANANDLSKQLDSLHDLSHTLQRHRWWSLLLWALLVLPFADTILLVYHLLVNTALCIDQWWYVLYCVHYFSFAFFIFFEAAGTSDKFENLAEHVLKRICEGDFVVEGSMPEVQSFFMLLQLKKSKGGIDVLGIRLNGRLLTGLGYVLGVVLLIVVEGLIVKSQ